RGPLGDRSAGSAADAAIPAGALLVPVVAAVLAEDREVHGLGREPGAARRKAVGRRLDPRPASPALPQDVHRPPRVPGWGRRGSARASRSLQRLPQVLEALADDPALRPGPTMKALSVLHAYTEMTSR